LEELLKDCWQGCGVEDWSSICGFRALTPNGVHGGDKNDYRIIVLKIL
jgi:hypothetical protein